MLKEAQQARMMARQIRGAPQAVQGQKMGTESGRGRGLPRKQMRLFGG